MPNREETPELPKQRTVFVNHEALNTWLRFGTLTPQENPTGYRRLEGAELLRWARQQSRHHKTLPPTEKK